MKKLTITGLFLIALFSISIKLDAAQCDGGTPFYYNNGFDFIEAIGDADANCCAGSQITMIDTRTMIAYIHDVEEDGPSSSCTIPE